MRKVALRGLFARKLRLALTALAVALGVSPDRRHLRLHRHDQPLLRPHLQRVGEGHRRGDHARASRSTRPRAAARQPVRPAVGARHGARSNPDVAGRAGLGLRRRHRARQGRRAHRPRRRAELRRLGRRRAALRRRSRSRRAASRARADEATIDAATAEKEDFELGDKVSVVGDGAAQGLHDRRLHADRRRRLVRRRDGRRPARCPRRSACSARTASTRSRSRPSPASRPRRCATRCAATCRPPVRSCAPARRRRRNQAGDIQDSLGFLTTALLAFAGISLFVGAFIIFNTFSITVTQRTREFALLRTLGASRGQVLRSVIGEGLLLGVARLARRPRARHGHRAAACARCSGRSASTCRRPATSIETRTIVVSLVVGTLVTLLAGLAPALRATRVPPVAALREGAVPTRARVVAQVDRRSAPLLRRRRPRADGRRPVRLADRRTRR